MLDHLNAGRRIFQDRLKSGFRGILSAMMSIAIRQTKDEAVRVAFPVFSCVAHSQVFLYISIKGQLNAEREAGGTVVESNNTESKVVNNLQM